MKSPVPPPRPSGSTPAKQSPPARPGGSTSTKGSSAPLPPSRPPVSTATSTAPATSIATCCPNAVGFWKATPPKEAPAYDDTTNLEDPANGKKAYWLSGSPFPSAGSLSLPPNVLTQDGSKFVSVAIGEKTHFDAKLIGASCFPNVEIYPKDPTVVEVKTPRTSGLTSTITIEGKKAGETPIIAYCNGNIVGWIYVWCEASASLNITLANIVTNNTLSATSAAYVASDLQSVINNIYRQALISVTILDAGSIVIPGTLKPTDISSTSARNADLLRIISSAALIQPRLTATRYQLYYHLDSTIRSGGTVPGGVGSGTFGLTFFQSNLQASYNSLAHELGHILDLSHPAHDFDKDEFPNWQDRSLQPSPFNVIPKDQNNLMGYLRNKPARTKLRFLQWKKCKRS